MVGQLSHLRSRGGGMNLESKAGSQTRGGLGEQELEVGVV